MCFIQLYLSEYQIVISIINLFFSDSLFEINQLHISYIGMFCPEDTVYNAHVTGLSVMYNPRKKRVEGKGKMEVRVCLGKGVYGSLTFYLNYTLLCRISVPCQPFHECNFYDNRL